MSSFDSTVTPLFAAFSSPTTSTGPEPAPRWFLLHPAPSAPSTLTLLASDPHATPSPGPESHASASAPEAEPESESESPVRAVRAALDRAAPTEEIIYGYLLVPSPSSAQAQPRAPQGQSHTGTQHRAQGVVLVYIAQTVGGVRRARAVVGGRGVAALFPDYSALITLSRPEEMTEELVYDKLGLEVPGHAARAGGLGEAMDGQAGRQEAGSTQDYEYDSAGPARCLPVNHEGPHTIQVGTDARLPGQMDPAPYAFEPVATTTPAVPAPVITTVPTIRDDISPPHRTAAPAPPILGDPVPLSPARGSASNSSLVSPLSSDPFPHPNAQTYDPTLATPLPQPHTGTSYAFPPSAPGQIQSHPAQTASVSGHRGISSAEYFAQPQPQPSVPGPGEKDRARKTSLGQKIGGVFARSSSSSSTPPPHAQLQPQPSDFGPVSGVAGPASPTSPKEKESGRFKPSSFIRSLGKKRHSGSGTPPGSPDPASTFNPGEFGALPPPVPPKGEVGGRAPYTSTPTPAQDDRTGMDQQLYPPRSDGPYGSSSAASSSNVVDYHGPIAYPTDAADPRIAHLSPPPGEEGRGRGLSPSPSAKAALAQVAQKRVVEEEEMMARYRDAERQRTVSASSRDDHEASGAGAAGRGEKEGDEDSIRLAYDDPDSPEKPAAGEAGQTRRRPTMPGGMESFSTPGVDGDARPDYGGLGLPQGLQEQVSRGDKSMLRMESDAENGVGLQSNNLASDLLGSERMSALQTVQEEGQADQRAAEADAERRQAAAEEEGRIQAEQEEARRSAAAEEGAERLRLREEREERNSSEAAAAERTRLEYEARQRAEVEERLRAEQADRARVEQEEEARRDAVRRDEARKVEEARLEEERRVGEELRRREEEEERARMEEEERVRREEEERVRREEEQRRQEEEERARQEEEDRLRQEQQRAREEEAEKRRIEDERVRAQEAEERRVLEKRLQAEEEERARKAGVRAGLEKGRKDGGVMLSGWITAQNARSPIWRRRWFRLSSGQLLLFKSPDDPRPISTVRIPPSSRIAETFEESQVQGSFKVTVGSAGEDQGAGEEAWFMYADSEEDRETVLMGLEMARA